MTIFLFIRQKKKKNNKKKTGSSMKSSERIQTKYTKRYLCNLFSSADEYGFICCDQEKNKGCNFVPMIISLGIAILQHLPSRFRVNSRGISY